MKLAFTSSGVRERLRRMKLAFTSSGVKERLRRIRARSSQTSDVTREEQV
jgi:hypothetical protein